MYCVLIQIQLRTFFKLHLFAMFELPESPGLPDNWSTAGFAEGLHCTFSLERRILSESLSIPSAPCSSFSAMRGAVVLAAAASAWLPAHLTPPKAPSRASTVGAQPPTHTHAAGQQRCERFWLGFRVRRCSEVTVRFEVLEFRIRARV